MKNQAATSMHTFICRYQCSRLKWICSLDSSPNVLLMPMASQTGQRRRERLFRPDTDGWGSGTAPEGWPIEWVILGWFFQITLLQAGIYARHTKEQEKYRSYMFYVSIFQRFWTFVLYNYTLQLQGKMAKISPKIHKIEIWPKSRPKVINSPNQSHRDHIWGMFEL